MNRYNYLLRFAINLGKIIRVNLQEQVLLSDHPVLKMCHRVEGNVLELSKSVLIDAELLKYRPSLVASGLYLTVIEIIMSDL